MPAPLTVRRRARPAARPGIADVVRDAVVLASGAQAIRRLNPAAERLLHFATEEVHGQPLDLLFPVRARARHRERIANFLAGREASAPLNPEGEGLVTVLRRDGIEVPAEATLVRLQSDARGGALALVVRDLTEREAEGQIRRRVEAELEAQADLRARDARRLAAAMEATTEGMAILRGDTLAYVNVAFAAIFGYKAGGLVSRRWRELFDDEEKARLDGEVLPTLARARHWRGEARGRQMDGTPIYVEVSLTLTDTGDLICACRDITDRILTAGALVQYAREVEDLYNNAPCGYLSLDAEGRVLRINNTALGWLGYARAEVLGRMFTDFLSEGSQSAFHTLYPGFRQSGWLEGAQFQMGRKDGSRFWVQMNATALMSPEGRFLHSRSTLFDITEQKRAELALMEGEGRFRTLADSAPVLLWMSDADGGFVFFNKLWLEFTGRAREQEVGAGWFEGVHPEDAPAVRETFAAERAARRAFRLEYRLHRWDGQYRWLLNSASPRFASDGEFLGYIGSCIDITDRRRAEESLRMLTRRLELATRSGHIGIWEWDLRTGRLIWDEIMHRLYGTTPDAFRGSADDWLAAIHPEDREAALSVSRDAARGAKPYDTEYRIVRADGRVRHIRATAVVTRDAEGRVDRLVGINLDITEQREAAEALRRSRDRIDAANEELRRAARLKDEFLSSMSHELRTPMTAILGMAEVLEEGLQGPLDQAQRQAVRAIRESGEHLLSLINDILDLSRIEAGKLTLAPAPVALPGVVRSCLTLFEPQIARKELRVSVELPAEASIITADERRLKQIVLNLLSNAVKFTPAGGEVGVRAERDDVAGVVRLVVWDTGIGIAAGDLGRLFQPFVQLDGGLARQYVGTGLGLSLVRRLTELHGGGVSVESEPGRGSRFIVTFPLRGAEGPQWPGPGSVGAARVLVADADAASRQALTQCLRDWGFECLEAAAEPEVVEQAARARPDLVVVDVAISGAAGLELIRALCAASGAAVLAIGAEDADTGRAACLQAGAVAYLPRPYPVRDLAHTLAEVLNRRRGGTSS